MIPVTLLTGHLGSGKTTILNEYLRQPDVEPAMVIVNEFGDVGLDHLLMRETQENVVLLQNGCLCCSVRDDLIATLKELAEGVKAGRIPAFSRVIIETTGLADPVPVIHSMMTDLFVMLNYQLAGITTVVDAVNGVSVLGRFGEAARQVGLADSIILTKTDLATPEQIAAVRAEIARINPDAGITHKTGAPLGRALLEGERFDPVKRSADLLAWSSQAAEGAAFHGGPAIRSYCITRTGPMSWDVVSAWIEELIALHGEKLLRIKGIVDIEGHDAPFVVHGIQHLFHPPVQLEAWPEGERKSTIVLIVDGLGRDVIEEILVRAEVKALMGAVA